MPVYCLTRWTPITRFLGNGRICLSNNAAKRAVREVALGKKNLKAIRISRLVQREMPTHYASLMKLALRLRSLINVDLPRAGYDPSPLSGIS